MPLQIYNLVGEVDTSKLLSRWEWADLGDRLSLQMWHLSWDKDKDELVRKKERAEETVLEHECCGQAPPPVWETSSRGWQNLTTQKNWRQEGKKSTSQCGTWSHCDAFCWEYSSGWTFLKHDVKQLTLTRPVAVYTKEPLPEKEPLVS